MNYDQEEAVVSKYLPEPAEEVQYSVDFTLYFELEDLALSENLTAVAFVLNPPANNVVYRTLKLNQLYGKLFYLDGIWALNAESPEAAVSTMKNELVSMQMPKGVTLIDVEIYTGEGTIYDHFQEIWISS